MLCQKCNKNEATIHMIKFINGEKSEVWLCEKCAKEFSEVSLDIFKGKKIDNGFQDIISGLFESLDKTNSNNTKKIDMKIDIVCKNCGMTASKLKTTLKVGCPHCYNNLVEPIKEILQKTQGSSIHVGKIPKIIKDECEKEDKIRLLEQEMEDYILIEDYENAALLRDKIKELNENQE